MNMLVYTLYMDTYSEEYQCYFLLYGPYLDRNSINFVTFTLTYGSLRRRREAKYKKYFFVRTN